jgi:mycobactin peptide synthetase MbtE
MNLLELVLDRAQANPDAIAVAGPDGAVTYRQLLRRAANLAGAYADYGVVAGDRIGIVLPPGQDAIAAALAAFALRAAYVPVDRTQPPARAVGMLRRCAPRLTIGSGAEDWKRWTLLSPDSLAGPWPDRDDAGPLPDLKPGDTSDVAYVIHTSGSTGVPKGVEIEHRSVSNLIGDIDERVPAGEPYTGSWWCSPDFDVAVWESWSPLCRGGTVVIPQPADRIEDSRFVSFLSESAVTGAFVPPTYLPALRDRLAGDPAACAALRRLVVSLEPISLGLLQDIMRHRPKLAVLNAYGPAEATIFASLYVVPRTGGDPVGRTPIGTAVRGNWLIVDETEGAGGARGEAVGEVEGELVIAGDSVGRGYLNASPEQAGRFITVTAKPAPGPARPDGPGLGGLGSGGSGSDGSEVRAYRTGDQVLRLPDGNLLFLGRQDFQMKVRGYRIEPGEVETAVRAVADVRQVFVNKRNIPGVGAAIVGYVVPEAGSRFDPAEVRARLRTLIPHYAVPTEFLITDELPLTKNGKVDRAALAELPLPDRSRDFPATAAGPTAAGGLAAAGSSVGADGSIGADGVGSSDGFGGSVGAAAGPAGRAEDDDGMTLAHVLAAWHRELREDVGTGHRFTDLGGTSLPAVRVANALANVTGKAVTAADVLTAASARDLAATLMARPLTGADGPSAVGRTTGPLTANQFGMWMMDAADPTGRTYLELACFLMPPGVSEQRLADALRRAVAAHPVFGATTERVDGDVRLALGRHDIEPRILSLPEGGLGIAGDGLGSAAARQIAVERLLDEPFTLEGGPLMRCVLFTRDGQPDLLVLQWHHLVVDGWSLRLFLRDLSRCHDDPGYAPAPSPVTVCDANTWLVERAADPRVLRELPGVARTLGQIPDVSGRWPGEHAHEASVIPVDLDPGLAERLGQATRATGLLPSAFLCAAYQYALARVLGGAPFLFGCVSAGRTRPQLERVTGLFVNTVLVRSSPVARARADLSAVRAVQADLALAHAAQEEIPVTVVVAWLRSNGLSSQVPQIIFSLDEDHVLEFDRQACDHYLVPLPRAIFEANLVLRSRAGGLTGFFEHKHGFLTGAEAAKVIRSFQAALEILVRIAENDGQPVLATDLR